MDLSLKKILLMFALYCVAGFFILFITRDFITKFAKFCGGICLIIYASLLVAGIGYASTMLIDVANEDMTTNNLRDQIQDVVVIIAFLSVSVTFLFGGVGTNLVYASLSSNDMSDVVSSLNRLETRIDILEQTVTSSKRRSYLRIFTSCLLLIGIVTLIYSQL
ncbi:hypothetical protein [Vibrio hepatarius]|uniref:hypothetical protein n=1 Tax=Vibrio hepatarius TaxID=171383 RepID=UPI001C08756C|nr:hypothetical protein [Vibrio hepatarius]MBU2895355.1 hypothetical protein [Vibrio hepatarius]